MGLINCPKCGESVSERAALCPHCNENLIQQTLILCDECGNEYESTLPACTKCGCPNSHFANILHTKKRKRKTAVVISAILIVVLLLGLGVLQKIKSTVYYENMETITYTMLDGAADAEAACNLITSVWYNAIYEEHDEETDKYTIQSGQFVDDFNDALNNLFTDYDFIQIISELQDNQYEVISLMKKLKNPPKKYEEAYSELQIYYDNYMKFTNLAISPDGSYNSVSDDFHTYDTETVNGYQKMLLYLN